MAKMLIEIPDKTYNYFGREWEKSSFDSPLNNLVNGLFDGTLIPDNVTNGDIIKVLFGNNEDIHILEDYIDEDWWNAPYKEHKDGTN